jgi:predicted transcriptional regulator
MTFADTVYDALPESGITYPDLQKKLGKAKSQIGTALRTLEAEGKAKRERIPKPCTHNKGRMDLNRVPKVLWRRT